MSKSNDAMNEWPKAMMEAVVSCPHSIDADEVRLLFDPKAAGPNALNQLSRRVSAALSTLPIAGEGKVKALEWVAAKAINRNDYHGSKSFTVEYRSAGSFLYTLSMNYQTGGTWDARRGRATPVTGGTCVSLEDAKAAAQSDYETRILSALISSPGKDGGQEVEVEVEVEAVALYQVELEDGTIDHISGVFGMPVEINGMPVSKVTKLYTRPRPASTALVERLTKALAGFAEAADVFEREYGDQMKPDTGCNIKFSALCEARSALAKSPSSDRAASEGKPMPDNRNLKPHAEALIAMALWDHEYAFEQKGGSMDFWDSLSPSRKRQCIDLLDRVLKAMETNGRVTKGSGQ